MKKYASIMFPDGAVVTGPPGARGESAYQAAVAGGYAGTEAEFQAAMAGMSGHVVDTGNPHGVTAAQVGAIPATEKSAAGGVAALDSTGKVPVSQLPPMEYDPAGSADAVQTALHAHAADAVAHVTAQERAGWDSKAAGSHTHSAVELTSGTLPVARGGTGVTSLTGTDYTTSRVRGIALQSSVPTSIPNGCIVGVYEVT